MITLKDFLEQIDLTGFREGQYSSVYIYQKGQLPLQSFKDVDFIEKFDVEKFKVNSIHPDYDQGLIIAVDCI